MADPAHVAEEFLDCWTTKDFERARTLLTDDLHFDGPIDTFDDADSYVNALRGLTQIVTGLKKLNAVQVKRCRLDPRILSRFRHSADRCWLRWGLSLELLARVPSAWSR
jgi:hypothetical protein